MEQALKVSRFADNSGKGHRAKGIENIRIPLVPYAPCTVLYAQLFKADGFKEK